MHSFLVTAGDYFTCTWGGVPVPKRMFLGGSPVPEGTGPGARRRRSSSSSSSSFIVVMIIVVVVMIAARGLAVALST